MNRDQVIKIAMVVCVVILLCAVIITSTGMFGGMGIGGYANAENYTAGDTEISGEVKNLDISWTSGRVKIAYHAENTVTLQETAKRGLSDDEKLQWWLDGDTLRVHFAKPGLRWNMPEKELTVTLPEGMTLDRADLQTTSADIEIPEIRTEILMLGSTSGDIRVAAEAKHVEAASTSGDQDIRVTGELNELRLNSTSGDIGAEADTVKIVDIGSTSGSIGIAAADGETVKAGSTSGNITVSLKAMKSLEADATSGNVTAALPAEPGFTAEVSTTSGDFTYDLALTRSGDRYVCGDGSGTVSIGTTSGDVRISAAEK